MSYADKAKAGGNTTEGPITDYQFTDTFPFGEDQEPGDNIYLLLEVTPDGADEPHKRSLYLGSGQFLRIEDEGKTLVSSDDDGTPRLYEKGEVWKFIASLEAAGFPAESRFPSIEEEKRINFEGMVDFGRVRIVNEIDEEATKEYGQRVVKKGKHKGKKFNRTYTRVTKFWAPGEEPASNGNGASAKASAKNTSAKATSRKAAEVDEDEGDDEPEVSAKVTAKVLKGVLAAAKGKPVKLVDVPLGVTRFCAKNDIDNDVRDVLKKQLADPKWLGDADESLVVFDAKKKTIAAPEEE